MLEAAAVKDKKSYKDELASAIQYVLSLYESIEYSKADNWTIPETDADGALNRFKHAGLIIKDGNVLPEYWNADRTVVNEASMTAMKREIENGRGVCIGYLADQAQPGQVSDCTYINRENWAQYTFNALGMDHGRGDTCDGVQGFDQGIAQHRRCHGSAAGSGRGGPERRGAARGGPPGARLPPPRVNSRLHAVE
ncbi:MAG: hypothetical protein E7Z99_03880 [Coriobacteriaceae bacterium]|nr:hypothetical protein [Coriobacteriaceae bacterium]